MNWLDIVLLVILALAVLQGLRTGLVRALFSFAGFLLGLFLASRYHSQVGDWVNGLIHNSSASNVAGFIIIFLVVVIVAQIIGSIVSKVVSTMGLGVMDRLGGAFFELFVTAITLGAILAVIVHYSGSSGIDRTIQGSAVARFLQHMPLVSKFIPDAIANLPNIPGLTK